MAHLSLSGAGGEKLRESWRETVSNLILDLFGPHDAEKGLNYTCLKHVENCCWTTTVDGSEIPKQPPGMYENLVFIKGYTTNLIWCSPDFWAINRMRPQRGFDMNWLSFPEIWFVLIDVLWAFRLGWFARMSLGIEYQWLGSMGHFTCLLMEELLHHLTCIKPCE